MARKSLTGHDATVNAKQKNILNKMNIDEIKYYIDQYKLRFKSAHQQEIYKLQDVKCFQENLDVIANYFTAMIDKSLMRGKAR